jgi:hypothetical protein
VKIIETDKSENKQVNAGQKTMDNFMKTSNRPSAMLSQIFLLNTIMYTYVWIRENKIMRTVNHSMTLLIA